MKLNLIISDQESLTDFENLTPNKLNNVVDASCEYILARFLFELAPEIIPVIMKKLARKGFLEVSFVNIDKAVNDYHNSIISLEEFSKIVNSRKRFFNYQSINDLIKEFGLQKAEQSNNNYIINVKLVRP